MLFASLLFAAACSASAQADQIYGPPPGPSTPIAIGVAPAKVRAPYDVQIIREGGDTLPTYALKDRFYVQGNAGERYIIRVSNPTAKRVEAVVSVDGLDVIDGEAGDLRKRGYVVPPYGDVRIEGFRTSTEGVATFRFSSVDGSYAGKKGVARNVGVIAVALFEEQGAQDQQQIIVGQTGPQPDPRPGYRRPYDYTDDLDTSSAAPSRNIDGRYRGGADKADAEAPRATMKDAKKSATKESESVAVRSRRPMPVQPSAPATTGVGGAAAPMPPPPPHRVQDADGDEGGWEQPSQERTNRPGLGTEFGEHRYSAATYTRFVRNNNTPIAIAELRYNDLAGLQALGIQLQPQPSHGEIMTRETADPFPGDGRFATPPR